MSAIVLILICSLIFTAIAKRLNIPAVIGQLAVGILLGPACLKLVQPTHDLEFIAELGVIFLMFLAGLESDLALLKKYLKPAVTIAIAGVIFPLVTFSLLGNYLDYSFNHAFFLGIIFAATSVSITIEVLNEYQALQSREGATILGAAVVDDILAVLILSFFISSLNLPSRANVSFSLPIKLILELLFVLLIYLLIRYLAPALIKLANRLPVYASREMLAVILCLALAFLAEFVGMSDVIGAFFAGVILSQTKVAHEIEHNISLIAYVFFIPIFFASIGLSMTFDGILSHLGLIILFTALALLTKLIPCILAAKIFGSKWDKAYLIGSGMVSRGEMALIVLQIGLANQLVKDDQYAMLIIVIILTTFIAPFMIKHAVNMGDNSTG
ncbi:MAG: cation:proton antiporter [Streptococcaceae bacterium]|jgi:monovalent cation:proton antiporter-2 (CPA2) family protein|nr:cation:proton antiporter [Streptococcaceae bacterium]